MKEVPAGSSPPKSIKFVLSLVSDALLLHRQKNVHKVTKLSHCNSVDLTYPLGKAGVVERDRLERHSRSEVDKGRLPKGGDAVPVTHQFPLPASDMPAR